MLEYEQFTFDNVNFNSVNTSHNVLWYYREIMILTFTGISVGQSVIRLLRVVKTLCLGYRDPGDCSVYHTRFKA